MRMRTYIVRALMCVCGCVGGWVRFGVCLEGGRPPLNFRAPLDTQGSSMEAHVIPYFVEDRGHGTQSYMDFLCTIHKGVISKH